MPDVFLSFLSFLSQGFEPEGETMKWKTFAKSEPAPPVPFNKQGAFDRIRETQDMLDRETWPELLTAWLQDFHPAELRKIRNATQAIDDAYRAGNDRQLDRALAEYRQAWLDGLALYRQQPELMEGQP